MAETLRELVVALSLDSSNFSRNMRYINQQIKEAESILNTNWSSTECAAPMSGFRNEIILRNLRSLFRHSS